MLAIGMVTCQRPGIDVHDSVTQLRFGGFSELLHIFCEPGTPEMRPMNQVVLHRNETRKGVFGNWSYCLRWLVEHTTADYVMVCEDDVIYARGAKVALLAGMAELENVGYWSLYTPRRDEHLVNARKGWNASNRGRDQWGSLAICFPRDSAERLLECRAFCDEEPLRGHTDYVVAQCFKDEQTPCYYHNPSLADHVGRISTIGNNWHNESAGLYFDPEFDGHSTISGDSIQPRTKPGTRPSKKRCRTAIVTVYQSNIPLELVSLQAEVINRFLPTGCEFEPRIVGHHALGLDDYFSELHHDAYLILDIDCIPLSDWVIPWFLENALAGTLVGVAQRANHFANDEHIYAGPCAMAFSRDTFEQLGRLSFRATDHGDVGEEFTYQAERLKIPVCLLWPTRVETPKWPLRGGRVFGHGTTYGSAVFHAFEISKGQTTSLFLEKCKEVLRSSPRTSDVTFFKDIPRTAECAPARSSPGDKPVFHEDWYQKSSLSFLETSVRATAGNPGAVLEIGCWEGRSTAVIANACHPDTLLAIDSWKGNSSECADHATTRIARSRDVFGTFLENMRVMTKGNVEVHRVDAFEFLRNFDRTIKFCHIDAANDYDFVRDVLQILMPNLAEGAVLFGHNFEMAHAGRSDLKGGVERAVREVLPTFVAKCNCWSYVHKRE